MRITTACPNVATVEETPSGQDAVARLASHEYDVILLDVRLPDLDGKAIWRRLLMLRNVVAKPELPGR